MVFISDCMLCVLRQTDLTSQHKDSVDVRQDAMETKVYVWPHQGEHRGQITDARLQLEDDTHNLTS